jgi:hypothetical protein
MAKLTPAVRAVERAGILLVYPIANHAEPASLWSALYPDREMKWSWDEGADAEVGDLWHLRAELAESGRIVYAKWFQGRATFFSKPVFTAMLARLRGAALADAPGEGLLRGLGRDSRELLELLEENSPVSTKELRRDAMTSGRFAKRTDVDRAMRGLWERLLVVGVGEVEDGAFPSLSVGATSLVFEPLWEAAMVAEPAKEVDRARDAELTSALAKAPRFAKHFAKIVARLSAASADDAR